jgi:hypothetical protein
VLELGLVRVLGLGLELGQEQEPELVRVLGLGLGLGLVPEPERAEQASESKPERAEQVP